MTAQVLWPRQTQAELTKFFGPAGGAACTTGKVDLPFAFPLAWDNSQKLLKFGCHQLVEHYGEKEFRRLRLDQFGGCYNYRLKRGSSSSLSTHAWGIAVDHDPERNQLKWGRDRASFGKTAYEVFWNIVEAEGAVSLGRVRNLDWMHFQFARL